MEEQAGDELGIEVGASSAASPRRARDPRRRPRSASGAQVRDRGLARRRPRRTASRQSGVYAMPSCPSRSTSWTSSSPVAGDDARRRRAVTGRRRRRSCGSAARAGRAPPPGSSPAAVRRQQPCRPSKTRCVGKIVSPGSSRLDEHDGHVRALPRCRPPRGRRAPSRSGGGRRRSGAGGREEVARRPSAGSRRQSRVPSTARSGGTVGHLERRAALVEQEDRLELRAHGAQQPKPALLRTAVRALVRAGRPRARTARPAASATRPRARARHAVRADVVLRERPERRLAPRGRGRPRRASSPDAPAASSSESGSVRWTTLCGLRARQLVAAPRRRSRRTAARRARRAGRPSLVVAQRAKRLDVGHAAGTVASAFPA